MMIDILEKLAKKASYEASLCRAFDIDHDDLVADLKLLEKLELVNVFDRDNPANLGWAATSKAKRLLHIRTPSCYPGKGGTKMTNDDILSMAYAIEKFEAKKTSLPEDFTIDADLAIVEVEAKLLQRRISKTNKGGSNGSASQSFFDKLANKRAAASCEKPVVGSPD